MSYNTPVSSPTKMPGAPTKAPATPYRPIRAPVAPGAPKKGPKPRTPVYSSSELVSYHCRDCGGSHRAPIVYKGYCLSLFQTSLFEVRD